MSRQGWNKNSFKPGDQITFIGNVAKSGTKIMRLRKVVFPNGKETVIDRSEDYAE
jgi:preprotein translocase subunit SecE